jgi:aldehyde dehydrogenase (NAD+)
MSHDAELFIGGEWVRPSSTRLLNVVSPSTEETIAQVPEAMEEDVDRAVDLARAAFDQGPWPRTEPAERAEVLRRIAAHLGQRDQEIGRTITSEVGCPLAFGLRQVHGPVGILGATADLAESHQFSSWSTGLASRAAILSEPVGVVAAIVPWNGPLYLAVSKLAPALAAGCTVVIKPAPETPLNAVALAEACEAAGLPPGVVSILPAGRKVGQHLVSHPGIDKVAFTGSTAAGRKIMATCAERMARVTLELGGKSAAIILDDADPRVAAEQMLMGTTMNTGQACALLSRILVPASLHDAFVDALSELMAGIRVGDPFDAETTMGPLVSERQRDRVENYLAIAQAEGAKIAHGGGRPPHLPKGWYIEGTILVGVENHMRIAREEVFGPVASVISYEAGDSEAVRLANDSEYGLHGAVFTSDLERGMAVARQVRTGTFTINGFGLDPCIPFGGYKQSGIGREGGTMGLEAYLETKALFVPDGFEPKGI